MSIIVVIIDNEAKPGGRQGFDMGWMAPAARTTNRARVCVTAGADELSRSWQHGKLAALGRSYAEPKPASRNRFFSSGFTPSSSAGYRRRSSCGTGLTSRSLGLTSVTAADQLEETSVPDSTKVSIRQSRVPASQTKASQVIPVHHGARIVRLLPAES